MGDLPALKDALFPNAAGMVLDRLTEVDGVVVAEAHSAVLELRCPSRATPWRRVHSRYGRRLAEYPAGGRRVVVKLEVRRFFCNAPACGRRTFVEQVEGLTTRYARAGPSVKALWRSVALVAGGRPGMRLCNLLAVPTGRARLLGQLHAPEVPACSPRVLGIDDFAFAARAPTGPSWSTSRDPPRSTSWPTAPASRSPPGSPHTLAPRCLPGSGQRLHQGGQGGRPSCPGSR
jgi:hypothetical protein